MFENYCEECIPTHNSVFQSATGHKDVNAGEKEHKSSALQIDMFYKGTGRHAPKNTITTEIYATTAKNAES